MSKPAAAATAHYVFEAHRPSKRRALPWPVCDACGLVFLKNDVTAWCIRMGCNATDHPAWRRGPVAP